MLCVAPGHSCTAITNTPTACFTISRVAYQKHCLSSGQRGGSEPKLGDLGGMLSFLRRRDLFNQVDLSQVCVYICAARIHTMYPWASLSSTRPSHQPLFYGAQLERLTYCVREWTAPRGTVVCSEGHMSAEFTFVRSGSCSVEVAAPPSSEALHLGIIGEGEFFGERSTLFHLPAEFTITAEVGVADDDDDDGAAYVAANNNTKRNAMLTTSPFAATGLHRVLLH